MQQPFPGAYRKQSMDSTKILCWACFRPPFFGVEAIRRSELEAGDVRRALLQRREDYAFDWSEFFLRPPARRALDSTVHPRRERQSNHLPTERSQGVVRDVRLAQAERLQPQPLYRAGFCDARPRVGIQRAPLLLHLV